MHKALYSNYNKKIPTMVIKLVMEKAYDRVNWSFLDKNLEALIFGVKWHQ